MTDTAQIERMLQEEYTFDGPSIVLGAGMLAKGVNKGIVVRLPLKTLNRHGLIAGATGTGKTKTLQLITEGLSGQGVPVLLMDIKGDLSGLAVPGEENPKVEERKNLTGIPHQYQGLPVELLSISDELGVRLRTTVLEFGPVLFSKILDLNDLQSGLVSIIFKYCDDQNLPLLDLKDFKRMLRFITDEGKAEIEASYGRVSPASVSTILRKVVELESQGADKFFGEPSFEVNDLLTHDQTGKGKVSIIRLTDLQDRPKLFSTFMLSLLGEVYREFEEQGDPEKPKLVIFIDEAHLLFDEASKELLDQIESIIKLIRSKGVGIFFCTQNPQDIPDAVLSQLGLKVQHALRAFTAKDRKAIQKAAENYPPSELYDVDELLTSLGIGEALVTGLNEKGIPTALVRTMLCAPGSRMGILNQAEIQQLVGSSGLAKKYNQAIDRESAYEILNNKLKNSSEEAQANASAKSQKAKIEKSTFEKILAEPIVKQIARTAASTLTRGLLGMLMGSSGSKRRRRY
jgi:uncharacterized protein